MSIKVTALPPLIIGSKRPVFFRSANLYVDHVRQGDPTLSYVDRQRDHALFQLATAEVKIRDVGVTATASTPIHCSVEESEGLTFMMAASGRNLSEVDGKAFHWQSDDNAILFSGGSRHGQSTLRSILSITFSAERLEKTWNAMRGLEGAMPLPGRASIMPLSVAGVDLSAYFKGLFGTINALNLDPHLCAAANLDDSLLRGVVLATFPELFFEPINPVTRQRLRDVVLDELCDRIRATACAPMSLTEMERTSGLSRRTLQYAFLERFRCTPLQWQTRERLQMAHDALVKSPSTGLTVARIAYDFGFGSHSAFTRGFRSLFGYPPSSVATGSS